MIYLKFTKIYKRHKLKILCKRLISNRETNDRINGINGIILTR